MDLYLARSASTMVGTQALMMAALQSAGGKTAQTDSSKGGWSLSANTSTEGQPPVLPPAPQLKDPKQLKKAISSRMQRQVWQIFGTEGPQQMGTGHAPIRTVLDTQQQMRVSDQCAAISHRVHGG